MKDNVVIKIYEHGELVDVRTGHNVYLAYGKVWLANMLGLSSYDPDVPEETARIRYMGLGIGGDRQALLGMVNSPPYSTYYPGTNLQRKEYPLQPTITALERPVCVSSAGAPPIAYAADPTAIWRIDHPNLFYTHRATNEMTVHAIIDGSMGDVVYGPFTQMPLSEAGLFLSDSSLDQPFEPAVAYYSFGTILFNVNVRLEFIWSARFGS